MLSETDMIILSPRSSSSSRAVHSTESQRPSQCAHGPSRGLHASGRWNRSLHSFSNLLHFMWMYLRPLFMFIFVYICTYVYTYIYIYIQRLQWNILISAAATAVMFAPVGCQMQRLSAVVSCCLYIVFQDCRALQWQGCYQGRSCHRRGGASHTVDHVWRDQSSWYVASLACHSGCARRFFCRPTRALHPQTTSISSRPTCQGIAVPTLNTA